MPPKKPRTPKPKRSKGGAGFGHHPDPDLDGYAHALEALHDLHKAHANHDPRCLKALGVALKVVQNAHDQKLIRHKLMEA